MARKRAPTSLERALCEALLLHLAFEATPQDRGGPTGPKGRALAAFIAARDAAIVKATKHQGMIGRPSAAVSDIIDERRRQIEVEGWTAEHDDRGSGQLALAGASYALVASGQIVKEGGPPPYWPFSESWWKPGTHRRDLVRAAALLIAEIERLDRAEGRRG